MRIESLLIERYGIHADRRFDFAPGLQVLYGPNEAGKTTLLQLIRDLFFGYKDRDHPYKFDEHTGQLKATAHCATRDGVKFWFSRQKGRPDQIAGELNGREKVDAAVLDRLVGKISQATYQKLFAFSLEELRQGGAVLKEEGLNGALFGAGMGGLPHLRAVQQRLQAESQELFNSRAKKPVINDLLLQIQNAKEAHRKATLRPHEYQRRLDELKQKEAEVDEIRSRLEEFRREQSRLTRYQKALPIQREGAVLRLRLTELPQLSNYPVDAVERFQRLQQRLTELASELASLDELPAESQTAAAQVEDERLLKSSAEIRKLRGSCEQLAANTDEEASFAERIETARRQLAVQLIALPAGWTQVRLATVRLAPQDVETLEKLDKESAELRRELRSLEERQSELSARAETLTRQLEQHPDDPRLPALEALLERRDQDWQARNRLQELQQRIAEICDDLEEQRHLLVSGTGWRAHPPEDVESLLAVGVPLAAALTDFDREWQQLAGRKADLQTELKRHQKELAQAREKLAEAARRRDIPDPELLKTRRQTRDAAWSDLKLQLTQSRATKAAPVDQAEAAEAFEQSLRACDALADELLKFADEVAHQESLQADVSRLDKTCTQDEAELQAQNAAQSDLDRRWQELWHSSGIEPHPPAVMLKWLEMLQHFRNLHGELIASEREELEFESELAGPQRELMRAFPDAGGIEEAWRLAQQLRDKLKTQLSRRPDLLKEYDDVAGRLSSVENDTYAASLKLAQLEQRSLAICRRYEFPDEWDCDTSRRTLQSIFDTARKQKEIADLESFVSTHEQSRQRFRDQLSAVIERTIPALAGLSPFAALDELESRLQAAEQRIEQSRKLAERQSGAERLRVECLRRQSEAEEQLSELAVECGIERNELARFVEQVIEAVEVRAEIKSLEMRLAAILQQGETEVDLANDDSDQIEGKLLSIADDIRRCQEEYSSANQQVGVMRHELTQQVEDDTSIDTAAQLANLHAKLATAIDQWAPLALADHLMTAARERFEKEHQPRLIREVEQFFRTMTGGEYQQIACSLDQNEPDPFTVLHRDGRQRNTTQLSTGTAEQLYLAIRLAYVADYARLSEPLPVVMDDVLVNFDEQRALETLDLLLDLAESSQILFLTCHRRTIDLLHQLQPDSKIVELNGSVDNVRTETSQKPDDEAERESRKLQRRPKRRVDRSDQRALFPPS